MSATLNALIETTHAALAHYRCDEANAAAILNRGSMGARDMVGQIATDATITYQQENAALITRTGDESAARASVYTADLPDNWLNRQTATFVVFYKKMEVQARAGHPAIFSNWPWWATFAITEGSLNPGTMYQAVITTEGAASDIRVNGTLPLAAGGKLGDDGNRHWLMLAFTVNLSIGEMRLFATSPTGVVTQLATHNFPPAARFRPIVRPSGGSSRLTVGGMEGPGYAHTSHAQTRFIRNAAILPNVLTLAQLQEVANAGLITPPRFISVPAASQSIFENVQTTDTNFVFTASGVSGHPIDFSFAPGGDPSGGSAMLIPDMQVGNSRNCSFRWRPPSTSATNPPTITFFTVRVTSNNLFADTNFVVLINNNAPVLIDVPAQSLIAGSIVDIPISATDANDHNVNFAIARVERPIGTVIPTPGWISVIQDGPRTGRIRLNPPIGSNVTHSGMVIHWSGRDGAI